MSEGNSSGGGIGLFGMMFIVFLTLKLTGYINWSWWMVTAPLWGGFLLGVVTVGIVLVIVHLNRRALARDPYTQGKRRR